MAGFQHDVAGGSGNLVATSVQSPNFAHGSQGWQIRKDGTAEFHAIVLPSGQGVSVYFQGTAPSTTHTGDLWYNTSNGLQLSQWNGSSWVPYQIGTGAIASQAITNALLASTVTARSIGGITTTISATAPGSPQTGDIWIDEVSSGPPPSYLLKQWNGSAWVSLTANATDIINATTITGGLIAASTITGGLIAAGTITASNIQANTITAAQIASGTITAAQIAASTITGGNIAASTITAANIAANTITASKLAAGIVYAGIVDGTTISGSTITAASGSGATYTDVQMDSLGHLVWFRYTAPIIIREILNAGGTDLLYADPGNANPQGALIASTSAASGTDAFGNTFQPGISVYQGGYAKGTAGGLLVQMFNAGIQMGIFGANELASVNSHSGQSGTLLLSSGRANPLTTAGAAVLYMLDETRSGNLLGTNRPNVHVADEVGGAPSDFIIDNGALAIGSAPTPTTGLAGLASVFFSDSLTTKPRVLSGNDSGVYNIGHQEASGVNQTINTTAYTVLNGSQVNIAASTYKVTWDVFLTQNQSAGIPNIQISLGGGAVLSFALAFCNYQSVGTPPAQVSTGMLISPATISNGFQFPVMASLGCFCHIECYLTASTGGNIRLAAKTSVAADTFTINAVFTRLEPRQ